MDLFYIQHVPFEGLGAIADWAKDEQLTLWPIRPFLDERYPDPERVQVLVILGGPMGVNDEQRLPWIGLEKQFIEAVIGLDRIVLGVCLGAQLIASVLGATVYPNQEREIGWFPVERSADAVKTVIGRLLPETVEALHWHGDTFDLPAGAIGLAKSNACRHQAFAYDDHVLGLQFHLEMQQDGVQRLISNTDDLKCAGPYVQRAEQILARPERFIAANRQMTHLLNRFLRMSG